VANSLTILINDVKKLLGLLSQVDGFAQGGGGAVGGNRLSGSLSNVSTVAQGASSLAAANKLIGVGVSTIAGVAGGMSQMMPDVAMTIGRESAIYGAGVASGGIIRRDTLERNTRLGLGQFQSSPGSSAAVTAMLAGRGMVPTSATFSQTVTSAAQATRYLGMPNEVAASAIEGLTSGPTSGMMMRNFGVFTSNPVTGQAMTQGQIFSQLADRWSQGRATTVEGTMESLRRGNLGSNIRNSGLDSTQQALLAQYMIDRASGINMDLSDPSAIDAAVERNKALGITNPLLDSMRLNSKQDELMNYATEEYRKGITDATDALIDLGENAVKPLIDSMGRFKATMDTFFGSNIGAGLGNAIGSFGAGALGAAGVFAGMRGAGKGQTPSSATSPGGKGGGFKMRGGGGLGLVAALAGGMVGDAVAGDSDQGSVQSKLGNAIGTGATWAGIGAMVGSVIPGIGTGIGAAVGGVAGAAYGAFTGGATAAYASNSSGGGSVVGTINPGAAGKGWSGGFGEQRYYGAHQGIDIPLAEGTKVYAAADGKISAAQSGQGARSYGLYVKIKHSDKYETLYAHLSRIDVSVGQQVTKGQLIGLSGNTGFSTGPHLHFGLYKNGSAVDPSGYISDDLTGGVERWSAGNNGGKNNSNPVGASASGSILDLVVNPGASITSASSSVLVSSSGVKGRSVSTTSVVASGMSGGITGLSSPVLGSMGGSTASNTQHGGAGGGMDVFLPTTFSSTAASSRGNAELYSNGSGASGSGARNNVTINVTLSQASEAEAKRLVKIVKQHLEEDKMLDRIGAR
jgi:murein DD-endopeptidase MepM/ murein hydrolase activator NlpD